MPVINPSSQPEPQPLSARLKKLVPWAPLLTAVGALFLVLFSTVYLTLNRQDIRQQASEASRDVELIMVPSSTPLYKDQLSTVFFRLNTHGREIDGVQVVFEVDSDVAETMTLLVKEPNGLRRAWDKIEGTQEGKRVSFALVIDDIDDPFSNGSPIDIAELSFEANETGNLALKFDGSLTKANAHKSTTDIIREYVIQEYEVEVPPSPSPRPSPSPTVRPAATGSTSSQTGSNISSNRQTSAQKGTATTATATVTVTSVGGATASGSATTAKACNQACTFSDECGDGFLCYQKQCRRVGNVTDNTCGGTAETVKVCNESCTQSAECQGSLICYQGNCRESANPESLTCTKGTLTDSQVIAEFCDQECVTNAECGDLLSCYRGSCRLATNPTSDSCTASDAGIADGTSDDEAEVSPSPSPTPEVETTEGGSVVRSVIRVVLVIVALFGLGIAGLMGYLWFKDRQTGGL